MKHLQPGLRREYEHWSREIGESEPYQGQGIVGIHDVLRAHFLVVDHFINLEHGGVGGVGPRSLHLLHSTMSRQLVAFGNRTKWTDKYCLCATLFFGLIQNHPFHDANKRTAFLVALYHLGLFGRVPKRSAKEFEDLALAVADRKLNQYSAFKDFRGTRDGEVLFIAKFFKSHTREVDKQQYMVTYSQLDRLLKRFGFELGSPAGNYIDLLRNVEEPVRRLGFRTGTKLVKKRVLQIGFPGWKSQVTKQAVRSIREAAELTHSNGVDSQVFFKDVDPLESLIPTYHASLLRLADR